MEVDVTKYLFTADDMIPWYWRGRRWVSVGWSWQESPRIHVAVSWLRDGSTLRGTVVRERGWRNRWRRWRRRTRSFTQCGNPWHLVLVSEFKGIGKGRRAYEAVTLGRSGGREKLLFCASFLSVPMTSAVTMRGSMALM